MKEYLRKYNAKTDYYDMRDNAWPGDRPSCTTDAKILYFVQKPKKFVTMATFVWVR